MTSSDTLWLNFPVKKLTTESAKYDPLNSVQGSWTKEPTIAIKGIHVVNYNIRKPDICNFFCEMTRQ